MQGRVSIVGKINVLHEIWILLDDALKERKVVKMDGTADANRGVDHLQSRLQSYRGWGKTLESGKHSNDLVRSEEIL